MRRDERSQFAVISLHHFHFRLNGRQFRICRFEFGASGGELLPSLVTLSNVRLALLAKVCHNGFALVDISLQLLRSRVMRVQRGVEFLQHGSAFRYFTAKFFKTL
jgi:hypothetical protein